MAKNKVEIKKRIPVVVVLGHVDHGKTTLLDAIRKTDVQKREPAGITQNIYVSEVEYRGKHVTFVDTPGHEVFGLMRAQGGRVADLALLIIAADEGVRPQTKESLQIIQKEGLKFIVVITKTDVDGANPQKVINELLQEGVYLEGYGGDIPVVQVSAVKGEGIDQLLETLFLYIEVENILDDDIAQLRLQEYIKDEALLNQVRGYGVVVDSAVDKHLGRVAFMIWRLGTPSLRDTLLLNGELVKLSRALDAEKNRLNEIYPGKAIILTGLEQLPNPGDVVLFGADMRKLQKAWEEYTKSMAAKPASPTQQAQAQEDFLEEFFKEEETEKERKAIVIRFDVEASKRSILPTIEGFNDELVEFKVIRAGVGEVTTADIDLAQDLGAMVVGFRVKVPGRVKELAKNSGVPLYEFKTVYEFYDLLEEIKKQVAKAHAGPEVIGKAKVLKVFTLSDGSIVAGSVVQEGKVKRGVHVRVNRGDNMVGEYEIVDLRRFKERVAEVSKGQECGINLGKSADIKEGDILEILSE